MANDSDNEPRVFRVWNAQEGVYHFVATTDNKDGAMLKPAVCQAFGRHLGRWRGITEVETIVAEDVENCGLCVAGLDRLLSTPKKDTSWQQD